MTITAGNDMNVKRQLHGMGIFTMNKVPTLVVFGGFAQGQNEEDFLDSVEVWNDTSETWSLESNLTLSMAKRDFAFASIPTELICP